MRTTAVFVLITIGLLTGSTVQGQMALPKTMGDPEPGYNSNAATDVALHAGGVWMATDEGAQVTFDQGQTWARYGTNTGLIGEIISAIFSNGTRVWLGTSHSAYYDGARYAYSDGVSYSDDNGLSWNHIDFSGTGQNIDWVEGVSRTVYDVTGHYDADQNADWVFFAAFAGGFLGSRDGGLNWRRIFPSVSDSAQFVFGDTPSERNRYFSCVVDTSRGDSLYVWAGTAEGIFQYIFATPRQKPYSKHINRIAFCDECPDTGYVFYGGRSGFMRGTIDGGPYISRFEDDGLPGNAISALIDFRGRLIVATYDDATGLLAGVAYSDNNGDSFLSDNHPVTSFNGVYAGDEALVTDFAAVRERLYMAAGDNGLFVSLDSGLTWEELAGVVGEACTEPDTSTAVNALFADGDTLLVGTNAGLGTFFLDSSGGVDSCRFHSFGEFDSTATYVGSNKVVRIKVQKFYDGDTGELDSLIYWTVNQPNTSAGRRMVGRGNPETGHWEHYQWRARVIDVGFIGDTAIAMGEDGIWFTSSGGNPGAAFAIEEGSSDDMESDVITTMAVRGDTVLFGSNNGFARSTDRGDSFDIVRINTDPLHADLVIHHLASQTLFEGLTGDFLPALDVQYVDDQPARVWASNRSTTYWPDSNAISVGQVMEVDSQGGSVPWGTADSVAGYVWHWDRVYNTTFAWNMAFYGDTAFAATDSGLIMIVPNQTADVWTATEILLENTAGESWVLEGTSVYGVAVQPPYLWVATDDRTVRLRLDDLDNQTAYHVVDSTTPADEVYAFPVPFSHAVDGAAGGLIDFHFVLEESANVTIKIFDFAMNEVATVIDNGSFPEGIYPGSGSKRINWDGVNDKGDPAAVGVYYFRVEISNGETHWGKLALIP